MSLQGNELLNISAILERCHICGPGERFVIWVQGCKIRCKGCWNQEMQSFATKHLVRVDDLVERIKSTQGIEGVTLVGGEPLDQSKPLLRLVNSLKGSGLTVMLYTGYEEEGILDGDSRALVDLADIVVSGPYVEEKRDLFSQWRGSLNQKVAFKNRYSERTSESLERINEVEVHIEESGHITLIGYPVDGLKGALLR